MIDKNQVLTLYLNDHDIISYLNGTIIYDTIRMALQLQIHSGHFLFSKNLCYAMIRHSTNHLMAICMILVQ